MADLMSGISFLSKVYFQIKRKTSRGQISAFTPLVLPLAISIIAVVARLMPGSRTIDDSYITFRYARNILAGNGFVYNPGEHVLGTTTPLYTLLLAGMGAFNGSTAAPFPQIAMAINAVADAITCLLLLKLGRRFGSQLAGLGAALVWAIAPYSVTFAIGGLETSVYVLLLVTTVVTYLEERYSLAAVTAGLSILTRPDALLLVGPLALDRVVQIWRSPRPNSLAAPSSNNVGRASAKGASFKQNLYKEVIPFGIPLLVWFLFATLYFGSPFPHSVAAKSLAYRLGPIEGLIRFIQHYATPFMGHLTFGNRWIGIGLVLYPFLYLLGSVKVFRSDARTWPALIYPWLYLAAFSIANPLIFRWYLTPPLPVYMLIILVGGERVIGDLLRLGRETSPIYVGENNLVIEGDNRLGQETLPIQDEGKRPAIEGDKGLGRETSPDLGWRETSPIQVKETSPEPNWRETWSDPGSREAHRRGSRYAGPIEGKSRRTNLFKAVAIFFLILLPLGLIARDWKIQPDHGLQSPAPEMAWYKLELLYGEAAEILQPLIRPGEVLAAGDVGVLGYETNARILDTVGLNSAQSLKYYPTNPDYYVTNYAIPPDLILDNRPDFIVILEVYGRKGLLKDPRFRNDYRQIAKLPTDIYGSDGMLIFERADQASR
jgi:hypothetical protein